jgi:hypothetical protein
MGYIPVATEPFKDSNRSVATSSVLCLLLMLPMLLVWPGNYCQELKLAQGAKYKLSYYYGELGIAYKLCVTVINCA